MPRPATTLFMLMSVDGKISTDATDDFDVGSDLPRIPGVREGLHQYYEIEQTTDLWSMNTGRVMAKMGANETPMPERLPVSFAVFDNTHLTERGVRWLCAKARELAIVTANSRHPALGLDEGNLHVLLQERASLSEALEWLRTELGCERLTVQSGGTVNGALLREKLIDYVDVVVAPMLIGGKDTPTLVDGASLHAGEGLDGLGVLELVSCEKLEGSYLRVRYRVVG